MNVTIKINCDNAAFENAEAAEVARILLYLHDDIIDREDVVIGQSLLLLDSNGNKAGFFQVTD